MAGDMPPDWAIERALTLGFTGTRLEDVKRHSPGHTAHIAFARYIAAHEEPPVDPLLIEARKMVAHTGGYTNSADAILQGKWDGDSPIRVALAALKRGMEIERDGAQP